MVSRVARSLLSGDTYVTGMEKKIICFFCQAGANVQQCKMSPPILFGEFCFFVRPYRIDLALAHLPFNYWMLLPPFPQGERGKIIFMLLLLFFLLRRYAISIYGQKEGEEEEEATYPTLAYAQKNLSG